MLVLDPTYSNVKKRNNLSNLPKNLFELVSLVQEKHEIFKINNQNRGDFFLSDYNSQFHLFPFIRNISASFNNAQSINVQLPNLTEACTLQALAFSAAITLKERWSLSSNIFIYLNIKTLLFFIIKN